MTDGSLGGPGKDWVCSGESIGACSGVGVEESTVDELIADTNKDWRDTLHLRYRYQKKKVQSKPTTLGGTYMDGENIPAKK